MLRTRQPLMQSKLDLERPEKLPMEAGGQFTAKADAGGPVHRSPNMSRSRRHRPLGLLGLSISVTSLGLYQYHSGPGLKPFLHTHPDQLTYAAFIVTGAVLQLIAGLLSFTAGRALDATIYSSQGGFFSALAILLLPIIEADVVPGADVAAGGLAVGLFFALWIATCFMLVARTAGKRDVVILPVLVFSIALLCMLGVEVLATVYDVEAVALHRLTLCQLLQTVVISICAVFKGEGIKDGEKALEYREENVYGVAYKDASTSTVSMLAKDW